MATMATAAVKADIRELAKVGARLRLQELDAEVKARKAEADRLLAFVSPRAEKVAEPERHRRRMTPKQRKAVSLRMKKYWAARHRNGK